VNTYFSCALLVVCYDLAMDKPLTKAEIIAAVAETTSLTPAQTASVIDALVSLAYKNAKNTFTIPGLGKLVLQSRNARVGRHPATGAEIQIPAKNVVKFKVSKAAQEAILGADNPPVVETPTTT
jgi:DNA-binding protein HU-beta